MAELIGLANYQKNGLMKKNFAPIILSSDSSKADCYLAVGRLYKIVYSGQFIVNHIHPTHNRTILCYSQDNQTYDGVFTVLGTQGNMNESILYHDGHTLYIHQDKNGYTHNTIIPLDWSTFSVEDVTDEVDISTLTKL